jgi:hypothetical protein
VRYAQQRCHNLDGSERLGFKILGARDSIPRMCTRWVMDAEFVSSVCRESTPRAKKAASRPEGSRSETAVTGA